MKQLALIGCGLRGRAYLEQLKPTRNQAWRLAGVADPDASRRATMAKAYGDAHTALFASGPELLGALDPLDGVIITSPNAQHTESLLPAMKRRLTILLEKPVATHPDDCREIWRTYQAAGRPPIAVGFVLRYTPFFRRVRQIIDDGALGQILTIDAAELMGPSLTSLYLRGWRRSGAQSGTLMIEKCSHDLDVLNWLVGAPPVACSSFAALTRMVPRPGLPQRCPDCTEAAQCVYSPRNLTPYNFTDDSRPTLVTTDQELCVFTADKDIPDHQVAQIRYADGVLATFTVCMDQPRTTRTLRICGSHGQLTGDLHRGRLELERHGQADPQIIHIDHDHSGHYGGDARIARQFQAMLDNQTQDIPVGLREGLDACAVGFAIEAALAGNIVADVPNLLR